MGGGGRYGVTQMWIGLKGWKEEKMEGARVDNGSAKNPGKGLEGRGILPLREGT